MSNLKNAKALAKISGKAPSAPRGLTFSGQKIFSFMKDSKVKGNFRDFVLFIGPKMLDCSGEYLYERPDVQEGQKAYVALLHKRDLHSVIGDEEASKFWCQRLRKRKNDVAHSVGWNADQRRATLGLPPRAH